MHDPGFPAFDIPVPRDGYRWWYLDAVSDDGEEAITLIAFVGSVFSPYYAWRRRRGPTDPLQHCALNAVLYRPNGKRWAFTERGAGQIRRRAREFALGPSRLGWDGTTLEVEIQELTAPIPSRLRGRVRITPRHLTETAFPLDAAGRHHWRPVAPRSRIEVRFDQPELAWSGHGYLDANWGDEPLERSFRKWNWARVGTDDAAAILYDLDRLDGSSLTLALRFDRPGEATAFNAPDRVPLGRTAWRMERLIPSETPTGAGVLRTLEDAPFYSRSIVTTQMFGRPATGMHESLSLTRFASPWVQWMLPFRAPRRG